MNDAGELLISLENRQGVAMRKFPGGGVEPGEGLKDALKREWKEELGMNIDLGDLFYVNEYYQPSAFQPQQQLIAFYYWVLPLETITLRCFPFDFSPEKEGEYPSWVKMDLLPDDFFTFPVDRQVALKIRDHLIAAN